MPPRSRSPTRVPSGYEINPATGRKRKICPQGKIRSPKGYCVNAKKKSPKRRSLPEGYEINPATGRRRKVCPVGKIRSPKGTCVKSSPRRRKRRSRPASPIPSPARAEENPKILNIGSPVTSVSFSNDNHIAVGCNNSIKILDANNGSEVKNLTDNKKIVSAVFSPDGQFIASANGDENFKLWNINNGNFKTQITGDSDNLNVNSLSFSTDGQFVVTCSENGGAINVWNVENVLNPSLKNPYYKKLVRSMKNIGDTELNSVVISPNNRFIAAAVTDNGLCYETAVMVWNVDSGMIYHELENIVGERCETVAFSPNGKYIAGGISSGREGEEVIIWNVENGELFKILKTNNNDVDNTVLSISFSPDSKFIVTGNSDKTVKLWNVNEGTVIRTLDGHTNIVNSLSFSADGRFITSGSKDKTVRIWDTTSFTDGRRRRRSKKRRSKRN
jgi:WD40 repeat protein